MTKLQCQAHDKRAMVLPSASVVHREDGSKCPASAVYAGPRRNWYHPVEVISENRSGGTLTESE